MHANRSAENSRPNNFRKLIVLLSFGGALVLLFSFLSKPERVPPSSSPTAALSDADISGRKKRPSLTRGSRLQEKQTAEERVAARLGAFSKIRRETARRYAEKLGIAMPNILEQFFDAADAGNWEEIDRLYKELRTLSHKNNAESAELQKLLPTAQETWGAHESAHSWPAQSLLDYGRDVLSSLKPNMVYVGGTDSGRFIPTFLNETSGDEKHIVLTQNAFADGTYLDYVNFLYGDRMQTVDGQDSQNSFTEYLADAAKRYAHDKDFPDEPKQMRPGENYKSEDGRVQVSGQVAVMSINELLLKKFQQKNPELSFAMEESFSLPSTYAGAVPLGPLLQLGSDNSPTELTPGMAAGSLDYWRDRVAQLASEPASDPTRDAAYAHMIVAQGNLFSSRDLGAEAEQAYRLAQQLAGNHNIEAATKLHDLLMRTGRPADAAKAVSEFQKAYPDKADALQKLVNPKQ